jgi:hypothetical protein
MDSAEKICAEIKFVRILSDFSTIALAKKTQTSQITNHCDN